MQLIWLNFNIGKEQRLTPHERFQTKRQMADTKVIPIKDGAQSKRTGINRARSLRKMLLIDPDMHFVRFEFQHFGNTETVAVNEGIVRTFKKLRLRIVSGTG